MYTLSKKEYVNFSEHLGHVKNVKNVSQEVDSRILS